MFNRLIFSVVAVISCGALAANHPDARFAHYKPVEAYEVRPGILMIPTYAPDRQVCKLGLEKLHYSPDKIELDSNMSRKDIEQIFDELVPSAERGPQPQGVLERGMMTFVGQGMVSDEEYQNVSIEIYGNAVPNNGGILADQIVATLKWKNRRCQ